MFGSQFSSCRCLFSILSATVELSALWLRVMPCSLGQSSRPCGWSLAFRRYPEDDSGIDRLILVAADTCWWHAIGTVLFSTSPAALPSLAVAREPPSCASGRSLPSVLSCWPRGTHHAADAIVVSTKSRESPVISLKIGYVECR